MRLSRKRLVAAVLILVIAVAAGREGWFMLRSAALILDLTGAAPAALGQALYDHLVAQARLRHPQVGTGEFGADMQVHLVNDGPVTIPMTVR